MYNKCGLWEVKLINLITIKNLWWDILSWSSFQSNIARSRNVQNLYKIYMYMFSARGMNIDLNMMIYYVIFSCRLCFASNKSNYSLGIMFYINFFYTLKFHSATTYFKYHVVAYQLHYFNLKVNTTQKHFLMLQKPRSTKITCSLIASLYFWRKIILAVNIVIFLDSVSSVLFDSDIDTV